MLALGGMPRDYRGAQKTGLRGWWLLPWALVLAAGCSLSYSLPVKPEFTQTCPDFSGDYAFLGVGRLAELCSGEKGWESLVFPSDKGFVHVADVPQAIEIRQQRCEALTIRARFGYRWVGGPPVGNLLELTLPLVRKRKADRVEWTQDGVVWRRKFHAGGPQFIPIWSFDYQEMELQLVPEGLRYKLRQKSGSGFHEKLVAEMECLLPRVTSGH